MDSHSSGAEARHFDAMPVRTATMPDPSARHEHEHVLWNCHPRRTCRHLQHTYQCVVLDPPVRRAARSTSIITNVDAKLVAVSSSLCGPRLDDCSPTAHGLGVPGAAAMRLVRKGGAPKAAVSAQSCAPLPAWVGRVVLRHETVSGSVRVVFLYVAAACRCDAVMSQKSCTWDGRSAVCVRAGDSLGCFLSTLNGIVHGGMRAFGMSEHHSHHYPP